MMVDNERDYWNMRFNEEQRLMAIHYEDIGHQACRPSTIYRPKLSIDGNMYCALYGENPMGGCSGFGKSPKEAYEDFDRNWIDHDHSRWEVLNKTAQDAKKKQAPRETVLKCEDCESSITNRAGDTFCNLIEWYVQGSPRGAEKKRGCNRL